MKTKRWMNKQLDFESLEGRALLSVSPFSSSASDPPVEYEIIARSRPTSEPPQTLK